MVSVLAVCQHSSDTMKWNQSPRYNRPVMFLGGGSGRRPPVTQTMLLESCWAALRCLSVFFNVWLIPWKFAIKVISLLSVQMSLFQPFKSQTFFPNATPQGQFFYCRFKFFRQIYFDKELPPYFWGDHKVAKKSFVLLHTPGLFMINVQKILERFRGCKKGEEWKKRISFTGSRSGKRPEDEPETSCCTPAHDRMCKRQPAHACCKALKKKREKRRATGIRKKFLIFRQCGSACQAREMIKKVHFLYIQAMTYVYVSALMTQTLSTWLL